MPELKNGAAELAATDPAAWVQQQKGNTTMPTYTFRPSNGGELTVIADTYNQALEILAIDYGITEESDPNCMFVG